MNQDAQRGVEHPGFFRDLLNRRVLQITGFYLGGGWGILQFLDWIVERYLLSPLLVDLALTIVASLLPSIVIMAYFHGKPGRNKWRKPEKLLVPANLVLTFILIFSLFGGKDLSSIADRVSVTDEKGRKIEKVVPKEGVVKDLAIFFLHNRGAGKAADWLQYGLVDMLMLDLSQDPFLNAISPSTPDPLKGFFVYQKLKDAGFPEAKDPPLMLKKKVAEDLNAPHFLAGFISASGDGLEVEVALYRTRDNKVVAQKVFRQDDVFALADSLAVFIKKALKLPSHKNPGIVDLPVRDMYTSSLDAARLATLAGVKLFARNDYVGAQKLLEKAVETDPSFTLAYLQLSELYAMNNQTEKWHSSFKRLMKHLYRLPQKMQMQVRAGYYLTVKREPEKALNLLEMIVKLYPRDVKSYAVLATRLDLTGNYAAAIDNYKKILEINPQQFAVLKKIGQAYEKLDDLENARVHYREYVSKFPTDAAGLVKVGGIEEKLGHLDAARDLYEQALLLEPDKVSTLLLVAGLDLKSGSFDRAWNRLEEALDTAENDRDQALVLGEMEDYFRLRGQQAKALEMLQRFYSVNSRYLPTLQVLIVKVATVHLFLANGREKEVKAFLDRADREMSPPFNKIVSVGYIFYYKHMGDLDAAQAQIANIEAFIQQTGNLQFKQFVDRTRADIAFQRKEYAKALQLQREIYAKDQSSINVIRKLAECLYENGEYSEGVDCILKGLKIFPAHPELNLMAARLYAKQSDKEKAIAHAQRALKAWAVADPGYAKAESARKLAKQLTEGIADA